MSFRSRLYFARGHLWGCPSRFYVELALDPRIKNAGGHPPALAGGKPPALGGPSIRGYRYLYTTRRTSDPSGNDAPASCALKVDSASLADGTHELISVRNGTVSTMEVAVD